MKTITKEKFKRIKVKYVGIAGLKKRLTSFEKKYDMSTAMFLQKIEHGALDESNDFIDWLGLSELYQDIQKRDLE